MTGGSISFAFLRIWGLARKVCQSTDSLIPMETMNQVTAGGRLMNSNQQGYGDLTEKTDDIVYPNWHHVSNR